MFQPIPNITQSYAFSTELRFLDLQTYYNQVFYYGQGSTGNVTTTADSIKIGDFTLENNCNVQATANQLPNYNFPSYDGVTRTNAFGTGNAAIRCAQWTLYYMTS